MASAFHVREDVAPLKPFVLVNLVSGDAAFHVREDVAPLKP